MLAGTSRGRDEVVGKLQPTNYRELWEFTVEKVAVNAVMAGADPSYFPVILALASSGLTARNSSTSSIAAMVVVNGPIRHEIGMNSGIGALGPYNHANATIGRAYGLLSPNLQGGSVPAETYMGSQGNSMSYASITFAENEEGSPWEPYHVSRGFGREESVVRLRTWGNVWTEGCESIGRTSSRACSAGSIRSSETLLVLDPIVAKELAQLGFDTKEKLIDWIHENVRTPARLYWNHYAAQTFIREDALNGVEPFASYYAAPPDELVPCSRRTRSGSSSWAARRTGSGARSSALTSTSATGRRACGAVSIDDWR